MTSEFGARLRAHREQQQIGLATIAEQTKIKASLLEGLERDDLSHWPGGVFRRSYVRAYATAIGLDPEAVLRDFQERFPEQSDALPEVVAVAQRQTGETVRLRPPTRLRFLIGSAIDALPGLKTQLQTSIGLGPKAPSAPPVSEPRETLVESRAKDAAVPSHEVEPLELASDGPSFFELTHPPAFSDPRFETADDLTDDDVSLAEMAGLCTRLARASDAQELRPVLEDVVGLLDAAGVTLWMWDADSKLLHPVITEGYPADVVAQLPRLSVDCDNAVGGAFRAAATRVVEGTLLETGAVVAPLKTASGCAGVLALELRDGRERRPCVRACVEILAAQLALIVGYTPLVHAATA